jgi:hypothetical protein
LPSGYAERYIADAIEPIKTETPMCTDEILENSAYAFEMVARAVQQQGFDLESHAVVMASSVNAGLALEFYAKCLSQLSIGRYNRSHDLQKILQNLQELDPKIHADLRAAFDDSVTNELREQVRHVETQSGSTIDCAFDSVVANWSRVFVEGRYWFEPKTPKTSSTPPLHWFFFDSLVRALRDAIAKKRALKSKGPGSNAATCGA